MEYRLLGGTGLKVSIISCGIDKDNPLGFNFTPVSI